MLVIGLTGGIGSGKSTAVLNILIQLYENDIPFIVFEPAKTEYRLLKTLKELKDGPVNSKGERLGDELRVYTLGQETISPFRFNPFEFPEEGISLEEAETSIQRIVTKLKQGNLKKKELDKVKTQAQTSLAFSEVEIINRAMNMAYFGNLGNPDMYNP